MTPSERFFTRGFQLAAAYNLVWGAIVIFFPQAAVRDPARRALTAFALGVAGSGLRDLRASYGARTALA
jgi:hypothetical protein